MFIIFSSKTRDIQKIFYVSKTLTLRVKNFPQISTWLDLQLLFNCKFFNIYWAHSIYRPYYGQCQKWGAYYWRNLLSVENVGKCISHHSIVIKCRRKSKIIWISDFQNFCNFNLELKCFIYLYVHMYMSCALCNTLCVCVCVVCMCVCVCISWNKSFLSYVHLTPWIQSDVFNTISFLFFN